MNSALLASSIPADLVARAVAFVVVVVGAIVLATLRAGYAAGSVDHEEIDPARIGGIGAVAGFASGISGAGWGPIGVTLLIVSRIDPRHAIGSSLVGRAVMAAAAVVTYAIGAATLGGFALAPALFVVLLAGSLGTAVPGTLLISRLDRSWASAAVAVASVGLAFPTLLFGVGGR